jgi:hypothetical protein
VSIGGVPVRNTVTLLALAFAASAPALADPISLDTWYEFSFTDPGVPAVGCDPADPAGGFCISSSGTPTLPVGAPPWTLTGSAVLTVTDAFESGDRFEVFDFGASLGLTSLPGLGGDCGDDPVPCLADPLISKGFFLLGAGSHEITLIPVDSPSGGGSGYLGASVVIPEPGSGLLFGASLAILALLYTRRARTTRS